MTATQTTPICAFDRTFDVQNVQNVELDNQFKYASSYTVTFNNNRKVRLWNYKHTDFVGLHILTDDDTFPYISACNYSYSEKDEAYFISLDELEIVLNSMSMF